MINIEYKIVQTPANFSDEGFNFFVEAGRAFDADDYASAYSLNRHDFDEQDVKATQNAATQLNDGECLLVTHSVN